MAEQPRIYFRPDNGDAGYIGGLTSPISFDGGVVAARYLAAYPSGMPDRGRSALADALDAQHLPFLIDPGTPELRRPSVVRAKRRLLESPIAQALPLPLKLSDLSRPPALRHFVEVVLSTQTRARGLVPPHLELRWRDEGALALNIAMLKRATRSAGGKRVVSLIQCTKAAFRDGVFERVAPQYGRVGHGRAILRVRSLTNEAVNTSDFERYLAAIEAFESAGVKVMIDCTGRLGPALVAGGARGFVSGWLHFRKVAHNPLSAGGGGSEEGRFEVPGEFRDVAASAAVRYAGLCSSPSCDAHSRPTPAALRTHFFHVLRHEADLAADLGPARYGTRLIKAGDPYAGAWGRVLVARAARAA